MCKENMYLEKIIILKVMTKNLGYILRLLHFKKRHHHSISCLGYLTIVYVLFCRIVSDLVTGPAMITRVHVVQADPLNQKPGRICTFLRNSGSKNVKNSSQVLTRMSGHTCIADAFAVADVVLLRLVILRSCFPALWSKTADLMHEIILSYC